MSTLRGLTLALLTVDEDVARAYDHLDEGLAFQASDRSSLGDARR